MSDQAAGGGFRLGVRLAIDWGEARIGVAACDPAGVLAYPVETVRAGDQEMGRLVALVVEYEPLEVVVGLPRTLSGEEGIAATKIRQKAVGLAVALAGGSPSQALGVPVRLVDERLTTVTASRRLSAGGKRIKEQRRVIDQVAAVTILEQALDGERAQGQPPGELIAVS